MKHIMLDLETMDTSSTAVVLSIGAVAFDPNSNTLGDRFYLELVDDVPAQQARGRTISGDTVNWWMQQSDDARKLFARVAPGTETPQRVSTFEALSRFGLFVAANGDKDAEIWGNGADFDNIILGNLYEAFGLRKPWSYSRNRCYRTMKNIGVGPRRATRVGTHHNALDDAVTQASHLQEIIACLKSR
jgi:hypothetical protein